MHLTVYGEEQLKNKRKPTRSLHWGRVTVRLPVLFQCGFMSSSGRFNRFYTWVWLFMMTGRAWLHVAVLKAPEEDTEEIQNKTEPPQMLKWLAKMLQLRFFCQTWLKIWEKRVFFVNGWMLQDFKLCSTSSPPQGHRLWLIMHQREASSCWELTSRAEINLIMWLTGLLNNLPSFASTLQMLPVAFSQHGHLRSNRFRPCSIWCVRLPSNIYYLPSRQIQNPELCLRSIMQTAPKQICNVENQQNKVKKKKKQRSCLIERLHPAGGNLVN